MDQRDCSFWLLHTGIFPGFCAIGPSVNGAIYRVDALSFICGSQHVECDRKEAVAVRPAEQQKVEAPDSLMDHMVIDKGEQFHLFALCARDDGIIKHKALHPFRSCERAEIRSCFFGKQQ